MSSTYVEQRDGAYMIAGTRVSLDSIVYAFFEGQSAETIAQAFRVLSLEQFYGAITYYLAHREDVDGYLESRRQDFAAARQAGRDTDDVLPEASRDQEAEPAHALNGAPPSTGTAIRAHNAWV